MLESNRDNPIAYFESFLEVQYHVLKNEFYDWFKGHPEYDWSKQRGFYEIKDEFTSNFKKVYFSEHISKKLTKEVSNSSVIINSITLSVNEETVPEILNQLLKRIKKLVKNSNDYSIPEIELYQDSLNKLQSILIFNYKELIDSRLIKSTTQVSNIPKGFKCRARFKSKLKSLFDELVKNNVISYTSNFDDFNKIFSPNEITSPINLNWTFRVKGRPSKSTLFFFIDELIERNIIDEKPARDLNKKESHIRLKQMEFMFLLNGNSLKKGLVQSKSDYLKKVNNFPTQQELLLEEIVSNIL